MDARSEAVAKDVKTAPVRAYGDRLAAGLSPSHENRRCQTRKSRTGACCQPIRNQRA